MKYLVLTAALVTAITALTVRAETPENHPALRLAQSPFTPKHADDRDKDCMDDAAEFRVAHYFAPYMIFDSRENALRPGEPVVPYRVKSNLRRPHCTKIPETIHITYGLLWADDGGYVNSTFCGDQHRGDNQSLKITVKVEEGGTVFRLVNVDNGLYQWPRDAMELKYGRHPMIYMSAGKHHQFFDTKVDGQPSPDSAYGCTEGMDGKGARVMARLDYPNTPGNTTNVGEPWAHDDRYFLGTLEDLGFWGAHVWGTTPFCGGHLGGCDTDTTGSMRALWGD